MQRRKAKGVPRWMVLLLAFSLAIGSFLTISHVAKNSNKTNSNSSGISPLTYYPSFWQNTIGGDKQLTAKDFKKLDDISQSDLPKIDATEVKALAANIWSAEITGQGRVKYPDYFPITTAESICTNFNIVAISPFSVPFSGSTKYAKSLVAWNASCPQTVELGLRATGVQINYVYAKKLIDGSWQPVQDWQMPQPSTLSNLPQNFELKNFTTCGNTKNTNYKDRIIVVDAFTQMCQEALKDKVSLSITAGFRTIKEQKSLYAAAVEYYGKSTAKQWVAYADDTSCQSKHCDGSAVDLENNKNALNWMYQIVACDINGKITPTNTGCKTGSSVNRFQKYGFTAPASNIPTYFEFYLPLANTPFTKTSSCAPEGSSTPQTIASIWRCRLQQVNITGELQAKIVAEALVVSKCESGWNPAVVAYGGRYKNQVNPNTNLTYDNSGLFMLTDALADKIVPGGSAASLDATANTNGAASLWLATHNWDSFGCATGKGAAFEAGPVLPQYGGAALPSWAYTY